MNERILNEFASYYKRLIRVERNLKDLILTKYTVAYNNKAFDMIYKIFLCKLRLYTNNKDKTFYDIYKNQSKTNTEKLILAIDKMYISEVLSFFSHRIYLKDKIRKNFFDTSVATNKNDFRLIAKKF